MKKLLVLAMLAGLGLSGWACGTIIDSVEGWEIRVDDVFEGKVTVFEDGVFGDVVVIEIFKNFESPVFNEFGIGQALVLEFTKISESAPSTIVIANEHIWNDTGVDWYDFHMSVSPNMNSSTAVGVGFDPGHIFAADTADNPFQTVEFSRYNGLEVGGEATPTRIDFSDGIVPAGTKWIPGNDGSYAKIVTDLGVGDTFWLKEWPTIPEPATFGLLLSGIVWVVRRRRA